MAKEIVLIIGGPGSRKTTVINGLTEKGYVCYPEVSREVIHEARKQGIEQLFLEKPLLFSELLLEGQKKQFQNALKENEYYVFIDRGIPECTGVYALHWRVHPAFLTKPAREHKIFPHFNYSAWEEIYTSDDARYETYEQAVLIQQHLIETYGKNTVIR